MNVVRRSVKTFKEVLACECGGEYTFTGITLLTYPEQYRHQCCNCGKMETTTILYPRIVTEDVQDEGDNSREQDD